MRRWLPAVALLAAAAGLVLAGGASASAATSQAVTPATCKGTVHITSLAFSPETVTPGHSSVATLRARNCTGKTQQTSTFWFGRFVGSGPGIPTGCPAIDPLPRGATFQPYGKVKVSTSYLVFPSCTASSLQLTVRIVGSTPPTPP
jgi:hypothetical protein